MTHHPLHKPALIGALTALTLATSACSGGHDDTTSEKTAGSNVSVTSASKSPNAPVLPLGQVVKVPQDGPPQESPKEVMTSLPGLNGAVYTLTTSRLTTGTLAGITDENGKNRTAPDDGALLNIGFTVHDAAPAMTGSTGTDSASTKPISITVEDKAGKATQVATIKESVTSSQWLVSVPKDATTVTLSSDGGKQVIKLSDGTRDDAASSGLPVDAKVTAPVTSASTCDAASTPTQELSPGVTASGAMGCGVGWYAIDHVDGLGWAPTGKTWLIAAVTPDSPQLILKKGSGFMDEQNYSNVENVTITATLDGKKATTVKTARNATSSGRPVVLVASPIGANDKPNKLSMNVTVTENAQNMQPSGFPSKVTGTLPATLTATDSTATITTGPNPQ